MIVNVSTTSSRNRRTATWFMCLSIQCKNGVECVDVEPLEMRWRMFRVWTSFLVDSTLDTVQQSGMVQTRSIHTDSDIV